MDEDLKNKLSEIDIKLNKILEYQEWEKKQWKEKFSLSAKAQQWGGFYIASLLADETLGLNGNNRISRCNK